MNKELELIIENKELELLIEKHRNMWNWIADKIEEDKGTNPDIDDFGDYKSLYLKSQGYHRYVYYDCFMCDYIIRKHKIYDGKRCYWCLLKWPSRCINYPCEDTKFDGDGLGLYNRFWTTDDWKEAAKCAREIANLPINDLYLEGELE